MYYLAVTNVLFEFAEMYYLAGVAAKSCPVQLSARFVAQPKTVAAQGFRSKKARWAQWAAALSLTPLAHVK